MNPAPCAAGILIIAAGYGRRFTAAGGQGDKLLARFNVASGQKSTVFARALQSACDSGLPVTVVTRPAQQRIRQQCAAANIPVVLVENTRMGESIAAGVRATAEWAGWIIHLGDMPFLSATVFKRIAHALRPDCAVRPVFCGHAGHPVGFGQQARLALCELREDDGARSVLRTLPLVTFSWHNDTILRDIDTPEHLTGST